MNRQFHNLPDLEQAGLEWKPYEQAREKIARIEERSRDAGTKAKALEQRIREEERADVRKLAEAILSGQADPAAPLSELDSLGTELREVRRERQALDEALPEAEEELRRTAWEHQEEWTSQADKALEQVLNEERKAYQRAQEIAQEARARRLYLEALAQWTRKVPPTFNVPADVAISSTVQGWEEDLSRCERQMHERRRELGLMDLGVIG
jgi:chromosome segregation ATPase